MVGVAAAVCSVGWFAIVKLTGYELGIVAIVVGIVVGGAVRLGSEGRGGWPYQIAAVLLTYLSIGASYVPLVMEAMREGVESGAFEEAAAEPGAGLEGAAAEEPMTPEDREVALLLGSVVLGLTLPVLQVTEGGFIGLLIVCFALFQAFKMNVRQSLAFSGPFQIGSRARAGST